MSSDLELWHVQLGAVVRTMTLDELDHAFQSDAINESTMVLKAGSIRWMTLAQALDESGDEPAPSSEAAPYSAAPYSAAPYSEQPNSIAPFATDIASSNLIIPKLDPPNYELSFGTEELAVFKPKRRVGRALAVVALAAMIGGGAFAVKSYGVANLKAKTAELASLVKGVKTKPSAPSAPMAAAAMQAPPPASDLPPAKTVNINSLPAAGALAASNPPPPPPDKNAKKKVEKKGAKVSAGAASKKANANDPTTKGTSDQFDPLNGKL